MDLYWGFMPGIYQTANVTGRLKMSASASPVDRRTYVSMKHGSVNTRNMHSVP